MINRSTDAAPALKMKVVTKVVGIIIKNQKKSSIGYSVPVSLYVVRLLDHLIYYLKLRLCTSGKVHVSIYQVYQALIKLFSCVLETHTEM